VNSNGERLEKSTFFSAHVIGQFVTKIGSVSVITSQVAIIGRRGAEDDVWTQIVATNLAIITSSARYSWFNCHSVTYNVETSNVQILCMFL
jgi:hypothetical protein